MQNFVFHNPVKVIFGRHSIKKTGSEAALLAKKILLVYGKNSVLINGIHRQVSQSLLDHDLEIIEHGGITSNPLLSDVKQGIAKAKSEKCQLIIGLGGGSVMDTAKAIASGAVVEHDIWKFFTGKKSVRNCLPIITIPTAAGSGSEINSGMVLTHDEKHLKLGFAHRKLHPQVCIADPTATVTVSPAQSAFGAVDTVVHCLESYFTASFPHPPFQFRLLENICKTVIENISLVLTTPDSYGARANLLWCASMAMNGLSVAGLGKIAFPIHLIEHGISARFDIPHGAGLAALLPGWLYCHRAQLSGQLKDLGRNVFELHMVSDDLLPERTISAIIEFFNSIKVPTTLAEIGITESAYGEIIDHCLFQAKIWRFKGYDQESLQRILNCCQNMIF